MKITTQFYKLTVLEQNVNESASARGGADDSHVMLRFQMTKKSKTIFLKKTNYETWFLMSRCTIKLHNCHGGRKQTNGKKIPETDLASHIWT
jgi:hypothetical protein